MTAIVQITAKRFRNARLVARGESPYKDAMFTPFWVLFGILGLIAGLSWTWRLDGTWVTGAVAGLGFPALATVIFVGVAVAQVMRK
ncbi:MAG: hypothetical protein ABI867_36185 [Kofleriaceae bacterium]